MHFDETLEILLIYRNKPKAIGAYPICNTGGVLVYEIDYPEDKVLAGVNEQPPEWYDITEHYNDDMNEAEPGFNIGSLFVPFSEVQRI